MKKVISATLIATLLTIPLFAQHSAQSQWQASTTANIAGYNMERAICIGTITAGVCSITPPEAAWVKINASVISSTTYTDTAVLAGQKYVYRAKAVCPPLGCTTVPPIIAGESGPSNTVAITIPTDSPQPPTNLSITSVAINFTNGTKTVYAYWLSEPGSTRWSVRDNAGKVLGYGVSNSAIGSYLMGWAGKGNSAKTLIVCSEETCVQEAL